MKIEFGKRYFLRMYPIHNIPFIEEGYANRIFLDPWVECEVVRNRCNNPDKITLRALSPGFGTEEFYKTDFVRLVRVGYIIEKVRTEQHVERIKWYEPITSTVSVEFNGYVVV